MKNITVYRFNPMIIYKGGGYPICSVELTDWDTDFTKAKKAFDEFNLKSISSDELEDMIYGNLLNEKVYVLAEIQSAEIPIRTYEKYLKDTSDIEVVGYACNYDFKIEMEKSFMPDGKKVPKKLLQSIY